MLARFQVYILASALILPGALSLSNELEPLLPCKNLLKAEVWTKLTPKFRHSVRVSQSSEAGRRLYADRVVSLVLGLRDISSTFRRVGRSMDRSARDAAFRAIVEKEFSSLFRKISKTSSTDVSSYLLPTGAFLLLRGKVADLLEIAADPDVIRVAEVESDEDSRPGESEITVADALIQKVLLQGRLNSVRSGRRENYKVGPAILVLGNSVVRIPIEITAVRFLEHFYDISPADLKKQGKGTTQRGLLKDLQRYYTGFSEEEEATVFEFQFR